MLATLIKTEKLTGSITSYYFRPERPLDHIAGQFTEMTLPHDGPDSRGTLRQFTISSSPTEELVAITIKVPAKHSTFKQNFQRLKPGDTVNMTEPMGDFVLPLSTEQPLVWIAGGIGITPFRSMAKWLADSGETRPIQLHHSIRDASEAIFEDIFADAGIAEHRLHDTAAGFRLTAAYILGQGAAKDAFFYVSGPKTMTDTLSKDLAAHGIGRDQIILDTFLGY